MSQSASLDSLALPELDPHLPVTKRNRQEIELTKSIENSPSQNDLKRHPDPAPTTQLAFPAVSEELDPNSAILSIHDRSDAPDDIDDDVGLHASGK